MILMIKLFSNLISNNRSSVEDNQANHLFVWRIAFDQRSNAWRMPGILHLQKKTIPQIVISIQLASFTHDWGGEMALPFLQAFSQWLNAVLL
jgi:hypothetical protein